MQDQQTENVELSTLLPWVKTARAVGRYGVRFCRSAKATPEFTTLYWANAAAMKAAGIALNGSSATWWTSEEDYLLDQPFQLTAFLPKGLLFDYQHPHAMQIAQAFRDRSVAFDGSDAGTGKTPCNASVLRFFAEQDHNERPLIICKKSGVSIWQDWCDQLGVEPFDVINYDRARLGQCHYLKVAQSSASKKKALALRPEDFLMPFKQKYPSEEMSTENLRFKEYYEKTRLRIAGSSPEFKFTLPPKACIVVDEVHKCTGSGTQNSEILIAAKKSGAPLLLLSATGADSPLNMRALGFALGLHSLKDYRNWCVKMGCRKNPQTHAWEWNGNAEAMLELHRQIFPWKGSRMRKSEIPGYPKVKIVAEMYDFAEDAVRLARTKKEHVVKLAELQADLDAADLEITRLGYMLQIAEIFKIEFLVDEAVELMEEGFSVVIALRTTYAREVIMSKLGTECAVYGDQTAEERDACLASFQANTDTVIVVNIQAGADTISLNDTQGGHPRVGLVCPTYSAKELIQLFGRLNRATDKSEALYRVIFAKGTPEEKACRAVQSKINNIALLNDGDLRAGVQLLGDQLTK